MFTLITSLVYKVIKSLQIKQDTKTIIIEVIIAWVRHRYHFKPNRIKYTNHTMYVKSVNSNKKLFFCIKKYLGIKGNGPQDIQQAAKKIPPIVLNSTNQKDVNPLNHNFLSPRVNLPNKVRRQIEIPQI